MKVGLCWNGWHNCMYSGYVQLGGNCCQCGHGGDMWLGLHPCSYSSKNWDICLLISWERWLAWSVEKGKCRLEKKNIYSNMFNYKQNLSSNIIGTFETEKKCEHCTVSSTNNCQNFKTNQIIMYSALQPFILYTVYQIRK